MSDTSATAVVPPGHLNLDVTQILLLHAPDLLSTRDLGRLSVCSKTMSKITDDAAVWKRIFHKAVAAGQTCVSDDHWDEHAEITWSDEPGLLECFANPSPLVIEKVGYKHAAGCLLSKTCFHCGAMSGEANPLTMTRICMACTEVQKSSWAITKSKAKEAFLLTDKDFVAWALPSASYPFGFFRNTNGATVLFLLSDVVAASFAKWGGPDGLESEITKHKAAAAIRYAKRQSSSKPQKKRPKIESLSSRPEDDLLSLRGCQALFLPIPVPFFKFSELKMTHCVECSACNVPGTTKDIIMHERLEHGVIELQTFDVRLPPPPERSRIMPETIEAAEELVQLLEQAEVKRDETHFENEHGYGHSSCCLITLGDCKVSVDYRERGGGGNGGGHLVVSYQTGLKKLPVKLCDIGFGIFRDLATEAEELFFDKNKLKDSLNLRQTTSSKLLAALVSCAIHFLDSGAMNYYVWANDEQKTPVFCHAWTLLGPTDEHGNLSD